MPPRKLPPNETIIELYDSGISTGEIAERFGVKPVTVTSLLRRLNHPMRSALEAARLRKESGRWEPPRSWAGKTQPPEMVERRISKIRGENHWLWKDGASRRHYRKVIEKTECERCGRQEDLAIHHINLDHYDNRPDNLQVLCTSCHSSLHKQAYWDAIHAGKEPPKSNAPINWPTKKGGAENGD